VSNAAGGSVLTDKDGSVWVGTFDGLKRWTRGQTISYRQNAQGAPPTVREIAGSGSPDPGVGSLFRDARGQIWVSTTGGFGYLKNDRIVSIRGVPGGVVHSIAQDAGGNLWVAHQDLGLFRLSPEGDVQQTPLTSLGRKDFVSALAADLPKGGLWLGFRGSGVAYFADGQIRASYAVTDGLGEGRVNDLKTERDGTLWAATEGGLSRLNHGRFATLTSRNGLPCDVIRWVMEDDSHSLWLGAACALVRIARPEIDAWTAAVDKDQDAKPTIQATLFDTSDWVISTGNSGGYTPHVSKSPDGVLWFATIDGVSIVDPRHLPFNSLPPPVHIEQIIADRKTYDTSRKVRLPPLVRDLQIDYTALSLVAPEKNKFRIRLEGWDQDWQDVGTRRQAFYTDLAPGNYRFRVMASNNSGVWNETGAALDFAIAPAYYQTAWFRTLAVAMFLSLLWAAHRLRLRIVERHEAEISALNESLMKAQEQERIRIAGELHDGVMQQISALSLMLGTARRQIPSELEARAAVGEVQLKLIQVGAEVRHLSHDLHPAILKEAGLPEALRGYCQEFSNVRGISVSCEADDSVGDLSRGAALALYRIAQEAMGNAVTHGAARHVDVRLTRTNGFVVLTVTDDGTGFDANRINGVRGLGLINMRERARQLHGTFELTSEPGRGTTVRVAIPFRRTV
jgi:signal transduction histidine kinase